MSEAETDEDKLYEVYRAIRRGLTPKGDPDDERHRKIALDIYMTFEVGGSDWFTVQLIRLINKSVGPTRARLALGFPQEVMLYEEWEASESTEEFYGRYNIYNILYTTDAKKYYVQHYGDSSEVWLAEQRLMPIFQRSCTDCKGLTLQRMARLPPDNWPSCSACKGTGRFDNQAALRGNKLVLEAGFTTEEAADKVEPDVVLRVGALLIDREIDEQRQAKKEAATTGEEGREEA